MSKRFKKIIVVSLAIVMLFGAVPITTHAWSTWQNVSRNVSLTGVNASGHPTRRANGQWRHRNHDAHVYSETTGTDACGVAIANGTLGGRVEITRRQGIVAQARSFRGPGGNTSGWDLRHTCPHN